MSSAGTSDEPLKITFVVSSRQDPELHKWLQQHPFKNTSTAVRALLNIGAAAISALDNAKRGYDGTERRGEQVVEKKPKKAPSSTKNSSPIVKKLEHLQPIISSPAQAPRIEPSVQDPVQTAPTATFEQINSHASQASQTAPLNHSPSTPLTSDMHAAMDAIAMLDKRF